MLIYRKEDLSVYYFLKEVFSDIAFLVIEDSYPEKILRVPTIAVDAGKIQEDHYELGNRDRLRMRTWYLDIFGKTKPQTDDFGYRILDRTKDGINIYDYDEGFPPDVNPTKIGHMDILSIIYEPIPVILDENENSYFRGQIILVTENDTV